MASKKYRSILVISDLHAPYMHKDSVKFYAAVKKKYNPDCVVNVGDEIDGHSWSYHEPDQSLPNPDQELNLAILTLKPFYKMFPQCFVMNSNHGSLAVRKGKTSKIPNRFIVPNKDALEAPNGWSWHDHIDLTMSNGEQVRFLHHLGTNILNSAKDIGMSLVAGHVHTHLRVSSAYVHAIGKVIFGMQVGCSIDNAKLAFAYNKLQSKTPAIGCGVIIDGVPIVVPMIRDKNNRWVGKL